ncbi:hypothetical protein LguiB_012228 [Lonicera macranthoides]
MDVTRRRSRTKIKISSDSMTLESTLAAFNQKNSLISDIQPHKHVNTFIDSPPSSTSPTPKDRTNSSSSGSFVPNSNTSASNASLSSHPSHTQKHSTSPKKAKNPSKQSQFSKSTRSNRFTPLNSNLWHDYVDEDPIQSWETIADGQFEAAISNSSNLKVYMSKAKQKRMKKAVIEEANKRNLSITDFNNPLDEDFRV